MTKTAKTFLQSVCVLGAVLFIVIVGSWRYTLYWPKVWGPKITVDGVSSSDLTLYLDWARNCGGVLIRKTRAGEESYALGFGNCHNWRFVWRCENIGFSFLPGLAFSNHEQWTQACIFQNVGAADSTGKVLSVPKNWRPRNKVFGARSVEFTADDGKQVTVEW